MDNDGEGQSMPRYTRAELLQLGLRESERRALQLRPNSPIFLFDRSTRSLTVVQVPPDYINKSAPLPASKAAIDSLPRITVTEGCVIKECPICLDEMSIGGEIREMRCKHHFHSGCIEKWLGIHGSCPVCRSWMPVVYGSGDLGDDSENGRRLLRRLVSVNVVIFDSDPGSNNSDDSTDSDSTEIESETD